MGRLLPAKDGPQGCGGDEPAVQARLNVHRFLCMSFPQRMREERLPDFAEDPRRGPRAAFEGLAIDGEETELWAVAVEPLEVVEERPVKVARDRNARGFGCCERREMGLQERRAKRIGAVGDTVLRDEDRKAEPARVAEKGRERRRSDLPSIVGE